MNPLLFGHNTEERIVGVQPLDDSTMRLWVRREEGVQHVDESFFPFLFLSDRTLLDGFPRKHWVKKLDGTLHYQYLVVFEEWPAMWDAVRHLLDAHNRTAITKVETYGELESLYLLTDPVVQFLMQSGRTYCKGMEFKDLYRLQLDIETYSTGQYRISNASRPSDRIILIALSDSRGWSHVVDGRHKSERQMLQELVKLIAEKDPDTIEGHNILSFDLPYLLTRAAMQKVSLAIGRNGSVPRIIESRQAPGEYPYDYTLVDIPGRSVVDTLMLVQNYDSTRRTMESHGLKYAAKFFGFASPDRTYIQGDRIAWHWDNDPEPLLAYSLDDVHETGALSAHLTPTSFYLAQMVPASLGHVIRMGAAAKIEFLMVRAYLKAKHSIPRPRQGAQTSGGYTDLFLTGVTGPVVLADVESLYPSLMLTRSIAPDTDVLGCFLGLLKDLTSMRLARKRELAAATGEIERSRLDAMQGSMKILINSFYGYLGYGRGIFNDYQGADRVTTSGQEILRTMMGAIRSSGGRVVEVDTDGVYFVPPDGIRGEVQEEEYVRTVSRALPEGITLAMAGRYRKMLSYRKKNYALLSYDNRIRIKGSSLISRAMERYGRTFVQQCIDYLLNGDVEGLHSLYLQFRTAITERTLEARDFGRVETLRETLEEYSEQVRRGKRNRGAAYEVALASGKPYRPGDRVAYYITGTDPNPKGFENCKPLEEWDPNFPDDNTAYYLRRLDEFASKFEDFFLPQDFRKIFSSEDLFPFDPKGVTILTVEPRVEDAPLRDLGPPSAFGIWLDE